MTDDLAEIENIPIEVLTVFPELSVRNCEMRSGPGPRDVDQLGLLQWQGRWMAMMAIATPSAEVLDSGPPATLPIDRVLATLAGYADSIESVQICVRSLGSDPLRYGSPGLAQIARELSGLSPLLVRQREITVTVRINPIQAGVAIDARGGGITGIGRLASAALSRVRAEAFDAGLLATPLAAPAALRAMSAALMQPPSADRTPVRWIESWKSISTAQVRHRSFVVTSWSEADLDALAGVPGYGLTITHEASWRDAESFSVLTLVRLSALSSGQLDAASSALRTTARRLGVGLRTLRGRQASALRITIPGGRRA